MRVYESPINQDEMISDAYGGIPKPEAGALVFEARMVDKKIDPDDPKSETYQVVDIVENFGLQPFGEMKKSTLMGWAKKFMPMRKKQLEENNPTKVAKFMDDAKKYVQYIATHITEFEAYMGRSGDPDDCLMFMTHEGEKTLFYFLEDACDNFKC